MKLLPVQTAEEALRAQVSVVSQATGDTPLPQVRVTVGAHVFAGIPVRIEERRHEPWLLLVEPLRDSVAYLPLREITTVIVDHVVTQTREPPSRLALERTRKEIEDTARAAGWTAQLAIDWPGEPTEDDRRAIEGGLDSLRDLLPAIAADALGRDSARAIQRIVLATAPARELRVTRTETTLAITVGMAADLREPTTLRSLIEQQL